MKGEAYARAITEATHLAALQHPNIVSVYDLGMDDRGPYVVMELIEGETLEAVANSIEQPFIIEARLREFDALYERLGGTRRALAGAA